MKSSYFLLLILFFVACKTTPTEDSLYQGQKLLTNETLQTIAFGSCNRQELPQIMWPYILENKPELWVWLGDNIYGDTEDMELMESKYRQAKFCEEYQEFRKECPVIGIWDDHDYGVNDGGKEFPKKEESKQLMLDFLDVPKSAKVRSYPGAHQSYTFGKKGRKIKFILLDARWFRDSLKNNRGSYQRYFPNETGDVLGEAQWSWLEEELTKSDAQLHIIASGIQMIPEEQGFEKWANFPVARKRFFELLVKTKPEKTILFSGDRHIAEISKMEIEELDYPLYEITSSGLTHTWANAGDEPNQYRLGDLIVARNFGILHIDWLTDGPNAKVQIRGLENELFFEKELW
ncbi:MAG: alkaline phosphatase family protein [Bacteroidetes bacterium]|nr:alkaline phosphatase family protein [Bacteroidota bacterium]